jgi:hypothetical protein
VARDSAIVQSTIEATTDKKSLPVMSRTAYRVSQFLVQCVRITDGALSLRLKRP